MKRCTSCKITKARADFNRNRHQRDGLQTECRECTKARCQALKAPGTRDLLAARVDALTDGIGGLEASLDDLTRVLFEVLEVVKDDGHIRTGWTSTR